MSPPSKPLAWAVTVLGLLIVLGTLAVPSAHADPAVPAPSSPATTSPAPSTPGPSPAPSASHRAADASDTDIIAFFSSSCAEGAADGTGTMDVNASSADGTPITSLPWSLTGSDGSERTGAVTLEGLSPLYPGETGGQATIEALVRGVSYTFALFMAGDDPADPDTTPVETERVRVLGCLTTTGVCEALRITNPPDNPAIRFSLGAADPEEDIGGEPDEFDIAPGATVVRRTAFDRPYWSAYDPAPDHISGSLGSGYLDVEQQCAPPSLLVEAGCGVPGQEAAMTVTARRRPEEPVTLRVDDLSGSDRGQQRTFAADGSTSQTWTTTVRRAGAYWVNLYLFQPDWAFQEVGVDVARCVTATVRTDRVTFSNPRGNHPVRVTYGPAANDTVRSAAADGDSTVTVQPGRTVRRPWDGSDLRWSAIALDPDADAGVTILAGGRSAQRAVPDPEPRPSTIPTPTPSPSAEPDPVSVTPAPVRGVPAEGGLADTGQPSGALPTGAAGLLLVTGGALLVRSRRPGGGRRRDRGRPARLRSAGGPPTPTAGR